ncbi:hypothetical protein Tco_0770107 [Tanacetum coccineum]|uniref:Retrotransposon gag domain-containing protein n=1 Tax=Tanacetum coccineum TaxID=301880 RepID=A0ABQ4ZCI2_9ASTR
MTQEVPSQPKLVQKLKWPSKKWPNTLRNGTMEHLQEAGVLKLLLTIINLVKIPKVDQEQLCIFAFPYSLTGKARKWWMHEGNDKVTSWVELVDKFFYKYYPLSHANKTNDANVRESHLRFMNWLSSKFKNPWKLSSATKNALWNFWEKGYDNDTLIDDEESSDDESDESNYESPSVF